MKTFANDPPVRMRKIPSFRLIRLTMMAERKRHRNLIRYLCKLMCDKAFAGRRVPLQQCACGLRIKVYNSRIMSFKVACKKFFVCRFLRVMSAGIKCVGCGGLIGV